MGHKGDVIKAKRLGWIPGSLSITKTASPQDQDENSEWQNGPKFLSLPVSEWPIKSAKEIAATARENIKRKHLLQWQELNNCPQKNKGDLQQTWLIRLLCGSGELLKSSLGKDRPQMIQSDIDRSHFRSGI